VLDNVYTRETSLKALAITCDEARVEQVLNNLMSNAIKYSPPGKPVVAGIEQGQSNEVIVWVRDQGPGIGRKSRPTFYFSLPLT
jgi:signal transduction histidine kinase